MGTDGILLGEMEFSPYIGFHSIYWSNSFNECQNYKLLMYELGKSYTEKYSTIEGNALFFTKIFGLMGGAHSASSWKSKMLLW